MTMTDPELAIAAENIRAVGKILEQHEADGRRLRAELDNARKMNRVMLQSLRNVRDRMAED